MSFPASYFRLNMFRQCARRYKLHYLDGLARDFAKARPYTTMGEHVHGALHDLFLLPVKERSEERLVQLMRDRWRRNRRGFADLAEERSYGEKATAQLRRFARAEDLSIQPLALEDFHKVEIDAALALLGKIDRIDREENGLLYIIDYKTGTPRSPEPLQLQIYGLIASVEFDPPAIRTSYRYLESGDWLTLELTEETKAWALEDVRQQVALILAEKDYVPSLGPLCAFCDFLEICPEGSGFVQSHPAASREEPPFE
jgi:putative RecB family exonuclease